MKKIIYNAIKTPDGTILESNSVHDYVSYKDTKTNKTYVVDGGREYLRRGGDDYEELSIFDDSPFEFIREKFKWGTYGKNGNKKLKFVALKDLDLEHIAAIIKTQTQLPKWKIEIFKKEYDFRIKDQIITF
jgi:hypothetical protein